MRATTGAWCWWAMIPSAPTSAEPLSKDYLRGGVARDTLHVHEAGFYDERAIELRTGTRATAIDAADRTVTLAGQERLSWDRLLLAVGAEPRRLAVPGADLDGVHYLRDLADCDRLRAALSTRGRLVVVGAGWIGSEVAASGRQLGMDVTLLERLAVPLEIFARARRRRALRRSAPRARGQPPDRRHPGGRSRAPAASSASGWPTAARSTARRWSSGSASPAHGPGRGRGAGGGGRGRRWTRPCVRARRTSTPPGTSPAPRTPSTAGGCAWSTGPTRSTRGLPPPAICRAARSPTTAS